MSRLRPVESQQHPVPVPGHPTRVILHIGLPKTGTTYLQNWLHQNAELLKGVGFHVPMRPMAAHRIATEYLADRSLESRPDIVAIRKADLDEPSQTSLAEASASGARLLLSSEYFWLSDSRQLRDGLARLGCEVETVIAYVRRQDRLMEAGYNQDIKSMHLAAKFPAVRYYPHLDWRLLQEKWAAGMPEARFVLRNYEAVSAGEGLLRDFLSVLPGFPLHRLPVAGVGTPTRTNESLSAELLELKRLLNELGRPEILSWVEQAKDAIGVGTPFRMNADLLRDCFDAYYETNSEIVRQHPGTGFEEFCDWHLWEARTGADLTNQLPVSWLLSLLCGLYDRQTNR